MQSISIKKNGKIRRKLDAYITDVTMFMCFAIAR